MTKRNGPPARLRGVATLALAGWLFQASVGCTLRGGPEGAGPGRRPQMLALTPEQELELGREAYREIPAQADVLPPDHPEVERVRRVVLLCQMNLGWPGEVFRRRGILQAQD
jgi:hypothetical protein